MMVLVAAVFLASVLGSLHCVGMCGAFLALAFADDEGVGRGRVSAAYHGGRLLTYVALGVAAGAAGSLLDLAGALAGVSRVALPLAGLTVAGFGLVTLLRQKGVRVRGLRLPEWFTGRVRWAQSVALRMPPARRALAIGLLSTLLPCGWLYAFAVTAAGTGDALMGGLVMAVFWAGTLPVMVSLGFGLRRVSGPLAQRLPTVTCVLLVVLGLWTVAGRAAWSPAALVGMATANAETLDHIHGPVAPSGPACCPLGEAASNK